MKRKNNKPVGFDEKYKPNRINNLFFSPEASD